MSTNFRCGLNRILKLIKDIVRDWTRTNDEVDLGTKLKGKILVTHKLMHFN